MGGDLLAMNQALADCLDGLSDEFATSVADYMQAPELRPLAIAPRGLPDCLPVLLVRPASGPIEVPETKCVFSTQFTITAHWELMCGLECAQLAIFRLMSGVDIPGSITHWLRPDGGHWAPLQAVGAYIPDQGVGPAGAFGMAPYNSNDAANTYAAQLPITLHYQL